MAPYYDEALGERVVSERALCPVLISRDVELHALDDALRAARRGEGQAVLLAGDAGIGKSRLAHELERRAHDDRIRSLWGGCTHAKVALPYLPIVEAIGGYLSGTDLDWLRSRLGPARQDLAPLFPQLDPGEERAAITRPGESKLRLFEAVLTLLQLAAGTRGLLVVLEDLHWADASTCELVGYLARRLRGTRIMVLVTYRGEELVPAHPLSTLVREWRNLYAAAVIELRPLSVAAVGEMVRTIFPNESMAPAFQELLTARCEGNPFVLEELLRHSLDRGFVLGHEKQWDRGLVTDFTLPKTVRDTLLARLDRLPRPYVEVTKIAAVLGPAFDYWTLVAASGSSQETVERAVQTCVEHQLMEEDNAAPVRYRFRHALTHEAIYDNISAPTRQQLHLRAAQALKAAPDTHAADLAYHLVAAGHWQEAIPVCLLAADEAERRLGYREAIGLYTRALPHVEDRFTRGQVLCKLGRAYAYADDPGRAWPYLKEGIPLLEERGLTRETAGFRFWLGRCFWERYRPDLARAEYERVRAMLEPEGPSETLANAYVLLGALEYFQLRFSNVLPLAQRAVALAEAAAADVPRIWGMFYLGAARAGLGQFAEALEYTDRCYREAVAKGYGWLAANAAFQGCMVHWTNLRASEGLKWLVVLQSLPRTTYVDRLAAFSEGATYYELGDVTRSLMALERGLELAREADATVWIVRCKVWKAMCLLARGSLDEALSILPSEIELRERLEHSFTLATRTRAFLDKRNLDRAAAEARKILADPTWEPSNFTLRLFDVGVEALVSASDLEGARQLAARARNGVTDPNHPYLLRITGNLALGNGNLASAEESLAWAAEALKQAGQRLDESRTRRLLARVHASRGNLASATSELRQVVTYADGSGASFEGEQAIELLDELGVSLEERRADGRPRQPGPPLVLPDRILATLLFLDIVGSTQRAAEVGDHTWRGALERFRTQVRRELSRSRGREVVTTGDGFLARFDGPAPAIRCAQAIIHAVQATEIEVRAGVHTGECELVGEDLTGIAVHVAARIMAEAAPGEVLVSRTVKDLVAGAGLSFADRGARTLKGVQGEWQLYAATSSTSSERRQPAELLNERDERRGDASRSEPGAPLSAREREVAALVAQGLSNKQIARRLQIAERTAENHIEHILNRLGFQSRAQVAAWAVQEGLV